MFLVKTFSVLQNPLERLVVDSQSRLYHDELLNQELKWKYPGNLPKGMLMIIIAKQHYF